MRNARAPLLLAFGTICLLTARTPAQGSLVLPQQMDGVEGLSSAMLPFSFSKCVRYQAIYQEPHIGGSRSFTQISFRSDWNDGKPIALKQYLTINLWLTNVPLGFDELSNDFAENFPSKPKPLVQNAKLSLPAQPTLTKGPRPFNVSIKFASPQVFVQDWSKGNVLLEFLILDQPSGSYPIDSCYVCESKRILFGRSDPACMIQHPKGPKPLRIGAEQTTKLGGLMRFTVEDALPDSACLFIIGTQRDGGSFLSKTLPFSVWDLFDPKHTGPDPAPGCYVNVDWLFLFPKVANSLGRASAGLSIPNDQRWLNVHMTGQAVAFDVRANMLGAVWSQGLQTNVCGPLPVSMVFATFDDPQKIPGSGQVLVGEAPVIELK